MKMRHGRSRNKEVKIIGRLDIMGTKEITKFKYTYVSIGESQTWKYV